MTNQCQLHTIPDIATDDLNSGSLALGKRIKQALTRLLSPQTRRDLKPGHTETFDTMRQQGSAPPSSPASLGLQAGDRVRVRSEEEIRASLDSAGELRGCAFMDLMGPYCGTTQRVLKPVRQFLDERDYRMKKTQGTVLLEGVNCTGLPEYGACDRACFFYWREEWLEKIDE